MNKIGPCNAIWPTLWERGITSYRWAASTICPHPGLQVVKRYTSCMHMDRSPLLYVHVGLTVQSTKAAWWPWPLGFDLESGVRVKRDVGYLCGNFSYSRCTRQTDNVRQTDVRQHHCLMPPGWGTNNADKNEIPAFRVSE